MRFVMEKFNTISDWLTHELFSPKNKDRFVGTDHDKLYKVDGPLHVSEAVFSWSFKESEIVNLSNGDYKTIHISLDNGDDWVTGLLRSDIPIEELPTLLENATYSHYFSVDGASVGFRPQSEVDKYLEVYKGVSFDDEYFDKKKVMNESWMTLPLTSDGSSDTYILEKDGENVGLIMDCDCIKFGIPYVFEAVTKSGLSEFGSAEIVDNHLHLIVDYHAPGEDYDYLGMKTHEDNAFSLANALYDNKDKIQSTQDKESVVRDIVATLPFKTFVLKGDLNSVYKDLESLNDQELNDINLTNEDLNSLQGSTENSLGL